jgi:hypothetical protein
LSVSPSLFSPGAPEFPAESTYSFARSPLYAWYTKIRIEPPQRTDGPQRLRNTARPIHDAGRLRAVFVGQTRTLIFTVGRIMCASGAPTRKALLNLTVTQTMSGRWE